MRVIALVALLALAASPVRADFPAPEYEISLDAAPQDRWTAAVVGQVKEHGWDGSYGAVLNFINTLLPTWLDPLLEPVFEKLVNDMPGQYGDEVRGVAAALQSVQPAGTNMTLGKVCAMNLVYELSAGCTSIVAQSLNGTIYHGRNLDYPIPGLANITAYVKFTKGGKLEYHGTAFVGYVGLLTGMKPGVMGVSIDERNLEGTNILQQPILSLISALEHGRSVGFFIRDTIAGATDYDSAVQALNNTRLITTMYFIVSGTEPGQGAVITRNRTHADDSHGVDRGVWSLDASAGNWWRLETNYDNWNPPPSGDDRRDPANNMMKQLGQDNVSLPGMFKVLSTPPVNNDGTKYTTLMCAKEDIYQVIVREH